MSDYPFSMLSQIENKHRIKSVSIDNEFRFILIASVDFHVDIFDLNKPGKEKYINYVNQIYSGHDNHGGQSNNLV